MLAKNSPSFDLPHRIHTSRSYPLPSPNGSTILVYGHEQGLRVVWKGGNPLKCQPRPVEKKPKSNGAVKDAVMVIESDEDATECSEQPPYHDSPIFEEGGQFDVSKPYEPVVQTLDLSLGVEVLHLAFPHLPVGAQKSSLESLPILFSQKIVLAVACSDSSVRVLSLPLLPPSPYTKTRNQSRDTASNISAGKSLFGEQMIVLSSGRTHRSIPKSVSISMTSTPPENVEEIHRSENDSSTDKSDLHLRFRNPSSRRHSQSRFNDYQWDLLIASHSEDFSGLLLIHRIPISGRGADLSPELHIPWRIQYLASPTVSVHFSPALYPSSRHSEILIAEAKGVVRILDCLLQSKAAESSWLLSLYTEFETLQDPTSRRKPILEARWVLGGKAILALLADGKWGIWDLENAGPKFPEDINSRQGTSVNSIARFALESWVGDSVKPTLFKSSNRKSENRSKLAPMTPGTRKLRQQALFTKPTLQPDGPVRGGLSVISVHGAANIRADDEAVLAWYGGTVSVISSLFIHWQNQARGSGNLFGSELKGEPTVINNIQLGGESCREITLIPPHHRARSGKDVNYPEILVTGDRRLVIVTTPLAEPQVRSPLLAPIVSSTTDQQLLTRGNLDVNGMDRILASMSDNQTTPTRDSRYPSHTNNNKLLMS